MHFTSRLTSRLIRAGLRDERDEDDSDLGDSVGTEAVIAVTDGRLGDRMAYCQKLDVNALHRLTFFWFPTNWLSF